jgi:hypothetical protein
MLYVSLGMNVLNLFTVMLRRRVVRVKPAQVAAAPPAACTGSGAALSRRVATLAPEAAAAAPLVVRATLGESEEAEARGRQRLDRIVQDRILAQPSPLSAAAEASLGKGIALRAAFESGAITTRTMASPFPGVQLEKGYQAGRNLAFLRASASVTADPALVCAFCMDADRWTLARLLEIHTEHSWTTAYRAVLPAPFLPQDFVCVWALAPEDDGFVMCAVPTKHADAPESRGVVVGVAEEVRYAALLAGPLI